jgi:hypothetical protein
MSPGQRFLPVMMHPPHEERADGSLSQARRIDRHAGSPPCFSARAAQPAHRLADRTVDGYVVQPLEEAIQSREVRHARQSQRLAQLAVFAQPHFGFAKGPVFVTHQAENGQQLRLVELVLAETASVTREHRLRDLQGDASKRQKSNFGHRASCLDSKQQFQRIGYLEFSLSWRGCQQSQMVSMTQVNRARLSATQKTEVWSRWKAEQSHRLGRV